MKGGRDKMRGDREGGGVERWKKGWIEEGRERGRIKKETG